MIIGDRLRQLREEKQLSQGDIEKRTGLLRCYISRVENGHTVPAIETLKSSRELSRSRCTTSFMTARSRRRYSIFSREKYRTTLCGAAKGNKRCTCTI